MTYARMTLRDSLILAAVSLVLCLLPSFVERMM
jgi:hypothetical protein